MVNEENRQTFQPGSSAPEQKNLYIPGDRVIVRGSEQGVVRQKVGDDEYTVKTEESLLAVRGSDMEPVDRDEFEKRLSPVPVTRPMTPPIVKGNPDGGSTDNGEGTKSADDNDKDVVNNPTATTDTPPPSAPGTANAPGTTSINPTSSTTKTTTTTKK